MRGSRESRGASRGMGPVGRIVMIARRRAGRGSAGAGPYGLVVVLFMLSVLGVGAAIQSQSQVAPAATGEVEEIICKVRAIFLGGTCPDENSDMPMVGPTDAAVPDAGDAIVTETDSTDPPKTIRGGMRIFGDDGSTCSVAFIVIRPSGTFVATAGHCMDQAMSWFFEDGTPLGTTQIASFPPDDDYGLILLRPDVRPAPEVTLHNGTAQRINAVGTAFVGQQVCKSGATTKVTCGTVLEVGVTVTLRDGTTYHNVIKTNICSRLGDSGGAVFDGGTALGIAAVATPPVPPTTPCRGPDVEVTYFTPIGAALNLHGGATLLTWP